MLVSIASRKTHAEGGELFLLSEDVERIASQPAAAKPLLESADQVLLYLSDRASRHFGRIQFHSSHDHTLLGFLQEAQMQDSLNALRQLGYVDERGDSITIEGWKRIEELQRARPNSRKAFVAMWFDPTMDDAWVNGFEPGIRDTNYFEPIRVSEIEHAGKIDDRIIAEIRTSGLLVADFTGQRGGVYYEAGFAAGLGIPVIWSCRSDHVSGLHFDTRQYNHIVWEHPGELRLRLRDRILAVVPSATRS